LLNPNPILLLCGDTPTDELSQA